MQTTPAPRLMGILNLTPDSFSDGGKFSGVEQAVAQGIRLSREGAAIIDVGGESTRPGSQRVGADEQVRRVVEPIRELRQALDREGFAQVTISIDTTLREVAEAALDGGAGMLNDVSAGREDAGMLRLAAERAVPMVLMHMRGQPGTMQEAPRYTDVVEEVRGFLLERAEAASLAGVKPEQIWIDPGIGFGKTLEHNLALLGGLGRLVATGHRVLLGASRKRFIAGLDPTASKPMDRLPGSIAAGLWGVRAGVAALRVHDVAEHRQALAVWEAAN